MSSIAKQKSNADFEPLDEGTHLAICNAVIDVGLQATKWDKNQEHVWLRFEVPAERIQYIKDGLEVDAPQVIYAKYNKTLTRKANLRRDLEGWRGREFTAEELDGFDLFSLVGHPCLLTVVHNQGKDRTWANVSAVTKILKGQQVPAMENDPIKFSPDDTDQYDDVPEWLQEQFDSRLELPPEPEPEPDEADFHDDDIPF